MSLARSLSSLLYLVFWLPLFSILCYFILLQSSLYLSSPCPFFLGSFLLAYSILSFLFPFFFSLISSLLSFPNLSFPSFFPFFYTLLSPSPPGAHIFPFLLTCPLLSSLSHASSPFLILSPLRPDLSPLYGRGWWARRLAKTPEYER